MLSAKNTMSNSGINVTNYGLKVGVIHFSSMKFSFLLPENSELDAHRSRCRMSNRLYVKN